MTGDQIDQAFSGDNKALILFNQQVIELNQAFCNDMTKGVDYTLTLEIHGNNGKMIHCRVKNDTFARPKESERPGHKKNKNH